MFFSLVIGVVFGFGTAYAAGPLASLTRERFELSERETGIFAFGVVLMVAAIIGSIFGGSLGAFWLILGGLLGAFAMRIYAVALPFATGALAAAKKNMENSDGKVAEEDTEAEAKDA